jgi:hypothetical protein
MSHPAGILCKKVDGSATIINNAEEIRWTIKDKINTVYSFDKTIKAKYDFISTY